MDRRDFLKTSAAAGVAHTFVSAKAASPRQSDLIKLENAKQGTTAWQLTRVMPDGGKAYRTSLIEGYCSKQSVKAGELIDIFVSTKPASKFSIDIFRMGYYDGAGSGSPTLNQKMLGMWATTWVGVTGTSFTQLPFYSTTMTNSNGELAAGYTVLSSAGRPAVTQYEVAGIYLAIFDASTSYYDLYYYVADGTSFHGLACTFPKTANPPSVEACLGLSYGFMAHSNQAARSLFPSAIATAQMLDPKAYAEEQDRLRDLEYAAPKAAGVMPDDIAKALAVPGSQSEIEAMVNALIRTLESKP